jgi:hypothetical protein
MEENNDFGLKEGPRLVVIPEQRYYSCWGCKHYSNQMIESGMNPTYRESCTLMVNASTRMYSDIDGGKTPDNCPFLTSTKREDKINDIL